LCCDPEDTIMEAVCCGEETYSAGVAGPCPDGGGAKCTYGATVVNPESGKVVRACAGAQLPHLKTGNVPERKGTS
jgi:hypothetical protein